MKAVLFRAAAEADVSEAYVWYERQRPGLGAEFRDELRATLERIAEGPQVFQVVHRDTRRAPMRRFPYSVFYRVYPESIIVIACMRGRRSPTRWQSRTEG
ncbi:MAG: type II toxin-antitoxin system RelE/ParE family toxin [Betaproteobacteria bacterium]|nr:type II toxin-antitoxin system RelE/ParE family toxin [Betaproteobacteria bacterium]